jgi:hypothetical protein
MVTVLVSMIGGTRLAAGSVVTETAVAASGIVAAP